MVGEDDIERLRDGYEAFNRGDYDEVLRNFDPDVEFRDRREVPDPRTYHGRGGVLSQFTTIDSEFKDYRIEPLEFEVAGEEHLVATVRQSGTGRASGVPVEETLFHLWHLVGGRVIDMRAFSSREDALRTMEEREAGGEDEAGAQGGAPSGSPPGPGWTAS